MASNIFDQVDYSNIVKRISDLNKNNLRVWGTMNIVQMLEHCGIQLKLGLGIIEQSDFEGSAIMRTGLVQWLTLYVMAWPKGLPTPAKMNIAGNEVSDADFESERKSLFELLEKVQKNSDLGPHPFFGTMNKTSWGRLIWKHIDHHLKQFGA